jgi:hypothetical protein
MLIASASFAQNEKFTAAMGGALQQLGEAKTGEDMIAVAQKFERIGDAEKTQWLPYYYAAMVKSRMSMAGIGGDKDVVADEATTLINKAEALEKNNSEILCVKSLIATAKMLVNPQARYMEFGMKSGVLLEEAKKADATNPRPYMLQAMNLKNTPEQFGGGCKAAKPLADKALTLYAAFKPASPLHPSWGKESVEQLIEACK